MNNDHGYSTIKLEFISIEKSSTDVIGVIHLRRTEAANAMNAEMISELIDALSNIQKQKKLRLLIVQGSGANFCSGADLEWMQSSAKMSMDQNRKSAQQLSQLFLLFKTQTIPTIALVRGNVFGGGLGIVAACDYSIVVGTATFCLSEVRLGLIPAMIYPFLEQKMRTGDLMRYALSARPFSEQEAFHSGLIQGIWSAMDWQKDLRREINFLLNASPKAQHEFKKMQFDTHSELLKKSKAKYFVEAISRIRKTPEAQSGMKAFFDKLKPSWNLRVADNWELPYGNK